jgi:site-specific recombinase XerD
VSIRIRSFRRGAERNIQSVVDVLSDRPLDEYSSSDAAAYRDYLLKRGLTTNSVKRNFATIRSVINLAIQEHGLECRNAFSKVYLPDLDDAKKRKPIPIENIKEIQQECMSIDDEARWLVALISDTGMRLSEAAGLHVDDIKLDCEIPHIDLETSLVERAKDQRQSETDTTSRSLSVGCLRGLRRLILLVLMPSLDTHQLKGTNA